MVLEAELEQFSGTLHYELSIPEAAETLRKHWADQAVPEVQRHSLDLGPGAAANS